METHPKPHALSLTADFCITVWLVKGDETNGVWVGDDEDGFYSVFSSQVTDDEGRTCETLQSGLTALTEALDFARKCQ
jgi:hypothetical protein